MFTSIPPSSIALVSQVSYLQSVSWLRRYKEPDIDSQTGVPQKKHFAQQEREFVVLAEQLVFNLLRVYKYSAPNGAQHDWHQSIRADS